MADILIVPKIATDAAAAEKKVFSDDSHNFNFYELLNTPWPAFPYRPAVKFSIVHTCDAIVLAYIVKEKNIKCIVTEINGPVWEDSCVEFFICFDGKGYYNFEFNCIGTAFAAYGNEKNSRELLPSALVKKIKIHTAIYRTENQETHWKLTAMIPKELFKHHTDIEFTGMECTGNFYKCGDLLEEPHFVAWKKIENPVPDFHLPAFFGRIRFE